MSASNALESAVNGGSMDTMPADGTGMTFPFSTTCQIQAYPVPRRRQARSMARTFQRNNKAQIQPRAKMDKDHRRHRGWSGKIQQSLWQLAPKRYFKLTFMLGLRAIRIQRPTKQRHRVSRMGTKRAEGLSRWRFQYGIHVNKIDAYLTLSKTIGTSTLTK